MSTAQENTAQTQFIDGRRGKLFTAYYPGERCLLFVPPFAEEMNRCRPMLTRLARRLAAEGVGTLIVDLYGTGDSDGDFEDATWDGWADDINSARDWLAAQHIPCCGLLAVRLGALLALDALGRDDHPSQTPPLLLWQPVTNGKNYLTQFLRLRVAATMFESDKETTGGLRERLNSGATLDVGGYPLSPDLAAALDRLSLAKLAADAGLSAVRWFELGQQEPPPLSPGAQRALEQFPDGIDASAEALPGDTFWMHYERTFAPALIDATVAALRS